MQEAPEMEDMPSQQNIVAKDTRAVVTQPNISQAQAPPTNLVKKSYTKYFIVIGAVTIALLLSVAGVLLLLSLKTTSADILQKTLITAASTNTLAQSAKISGSIDGANTNSEISIESDFSDPANPKSKGTVNMNFVIFEADVSLKSEFVCVSKTECYIKYSELKFSEDLGVEEYPFINKWLQFNPENDISYADQFGSVSDLNTVLGDLIIGNISGEAKSKIEQMAEEATTYTFTNTYNEILDGKDVITYDINVNKDKVIELNKLVAAQYGLEADLVNEDIADTMKIWVSADTYHILKAETDYDGVNIVVTFSKYNEPMTFTAPSDFLTPEQYAQ